MSKCASELFSNFTDEGAKELKKNCCSFWKQMVIPGRKKICKKITGEADCSKGPQESFGNYYKTCCATKFQRLFNKNCSDKSIKNFNESLFKDSNQQLKDYNLREKEKKQAAKEFAKRYNALDLQEKFYLQKHLQNLEKEGFNKLTPEEQKLKITEDEIYWNAVDGGTKRRRKRRKRIVRKTKRRR